MDNSVIATTTTVVNHRIVSFSLMLHLIVAMVTCKILIVAVNSIFCKILIVAVNSIFAVAKIVAHATLAKKIVSVPMPDLFSLEDAAVASGANGHRAGSTPAPGAVANVSVVVVIVPVVSVVFSFSRHVCGRAHVHMMARAWSRTHGRAYGLLLVQLACTCAGTHLRHLAYIMAGHA